jgi:hypothetical protein
VRKTSGRRNKRRRDFRTPLGRRVGDVVVLVLLIPIGAAAAAFVFALGVAAVTSRLGVELENIGTVALAGALVVMALIFKSRGWPAWTLGLEEDAARLGPFPRHRVPYEEITFIAAGTPWGWLRLDDSSPAYALRIETRSGRVMTVQLAHSDADKALRALQARAPNAGALDAEGHERLPKSGDAHAIIAARARLAAIWAPLVWLSFAGGLALVALCAWGVVNAARDGEWGAFSGSLVIGSVGGWALGTAWWKALRRMRGHRSRVQQAESALRASGQPPEA